MYPAQIVTGGGRGKGFTVLKYLPWCELPTLKHTEVWDGVVHLYDRLGSAYDYFYQFLGFLSPRMKALLQELQKTYVDSYRDAPLSQYIEPYTPVQDMAEAYRELNYPEAYARLFDIH